MVGFQLLVFGVLAIYAFHRITRWMHRRGWIRWKMRRGTSSALGNAVMGVQSIFQPPIRDVLEVRQAEEAEERESGDPPEPGTERESGAARTSNPRTSGPSDTPGASGTDSAR